jgi:general secretion pathway protein G
MNHPTETMTIMKPSVFSSSRLRRARRAAQRGMTLIEIMIVVVIMGLIASAVGIGVFNQAKKARVETSTTEARNIEHAVQLWQQDHPNGCPTVVQLQNDRVLDSHARSKDPWDNDYMISCEGGDVTVRSKGPDGQEGTDDDIPHARH